MNQIVTSTTTEPSSHDTTGKKPWAVENLPPFPAVAARLAGVLAQQDVDIAAAGQLISADPAFAGRVLQMANSPLFMLERQVTTISHAIIVLGLQRVKAITLTRALGDYVAPVLKIQALKACWRNSLAGALIAEKLARPCKISPDLAYLGGLMRDIGRLGLLVKYPEAYATLLATAEEHQFDIMQTERDLFDIDHCQAGTWVMETLPLPEELSEAVGHHHETPNEPFRLVHLVRIADRLADALGFSAFASAKPLDFSDVIAELPESAQQRLSGAAEDWKAGIDARIDTWC